MMLHRLGSHRHSGGVVNELGKATKPSDMELKVSLSMAETTASCAVDHLLFVFMLALLSIAISMAAGSCWASAVKAAHSEKPPAPPLPPCAKPPPAPVLLPPELWAPLPPVPSSPAAQP